MSSPSCSRAFTCGASPRFSTRELTNAEASGLSYQELLARLLRAQWHQAQQNALEWRIDRAKLPEKWSLESFPFKKQPGVSQKQIRAFAELDFIRNAENLVLIGPTGVGKTGIATGILFKALQNGYRGRFIRAQDLFDEMYASLADRSTRKLLNFRVLSACAPPPPEVVALMQQEMKRMMHAWLDQSVPALQGKTPREAARTKRGREQVDLLLRDFERVQGRAPEGMQTDVRFLRAELGLGD